MSNRYNKGRGLLIRPKVCASKPPVEAPVPDIVCDLEPSSLEIGQEESEPVVFQPDNEAFDETAEVQVSATPSIGEFDFDAVMLNKDEQVANYTSIDEDYTEQITVTFTWPNSSFCQSVLTVEVEGNGNGG